VGEANAAAIAWICVDVRLESERMEPTLEIADWICEAELRGTSVDERDLWHPAQ